MVVVQVVGGLGNQLFQYAFGRRIALANSVDLKLDISRFATYRLREFRLEHFNICAGIAAPEEVMAAKGGSGIAGKVVRKLDALRPYYRRHWIRESSPAFDEKLLNASGNVYLQGRWQSERYFADIEAHLRAELTLKEEVSEESRLLGDQMQFTDSISVHFRRGDYVNDPAASERYAQCSMEYYRAALGYVVERVKSPHVYVFSDEPEWTRRNFELDLPTTYVEANGSERDYEDLWLMSRCRHHVIANSTFSWWGAWLNPNSDKIVVAPRRWYRKQNLDAQDPIPASWHRV